MFAEFRISSTPIRIPIALRRESTQNMPSRKTIKPSTRKWFSVIPAAAIEVLSRPALFPHRLARDHDRPDQRSEQHHRRDLERQRVGIEKGIADSIGGWRDGRGAEMPRRMQRRE